MSEQGRAALSAVAKIVRSREDELLDALLTVETHRTACTELEWVRAALDVSTERLAWMAERSPTGTVYVASPATMPVYSFVLFALGPATVGNRIVLRPASATRQCADLMTEVAQAAGVNITATAGPWRDFAARACANADGMVFAGSRSHIETLDAQLPAETALIGQGPGVCAAVVPPTADIELAARHVVATRLFNSSQDCLATERVYVADEVFDAFADAVVAEASATRVGANDDPATVVGPLLMPRAAQEWYSVLEEQATILRASQRHDEALYDLAVVEAEPDAPVVLEETYCPILPLVRYHGQRTLQRMLAAGDFALALTVFGDLPSAGDTDFAHIAMNQPIYDFEDAWAPFGGYRKSTLIRHGDHRRSGPVLIPHALSRPSPSSR